MIKMDILDFGIYEDGKHIADFDDKKGAISYAKANATVRKIPVVVICNFTGEIIAEYTVVRNTVVKEWVAD
jgi:hypothetical protein